MTSTLTIAYYYESWYATTIYCMIVYHCPQLNYINKKNLKIKQFVNTNIDICHSFDSSIKSFWKYLYLFGVISSYFISSILPSKLVVYISLSSYLLW
jgi:hypothetical protein